MTRKLVCLLFHWRYHGDVPSGMHRYFCYCSKCGRNWIRSEP